MLRIDAWNLFVDLVANGVSLDKMTREQIELLDACFDSSWRNDLV